jgi:iron complex outermembrane receptor protein
LPYGLLVRTRVGALERLEREPYAVWDLYLARNARRIRPFVQFTNLNGAVYQEIPGVAMPGRAIVGGIEFAVFGGTRSTQ